MLFRTATGLAIFAFCSANIPSNSISYLGHLYSCVHLSLAFIIQVMETMRLLLVLYYALSFHYSAAQTPGFLSMDCGGTEDFTDELGIVWIADNQVFGEIADISVANETRKQYMTLRHFPADTRKYCYTFDVESRRRYLLRATFLYGNFDNNNVYPEFDISLGATHWSTIVISDASTAEVRELIFLAAESTVSVCLSNATTGEPFISTLELRQFNGSIYFTEYENEFYLSVSARINFGAESEDPVRYPHDPFDRIWESDSLKKANYLVDVAVGTQRVSTQIPIYVNKDERPPEKVMQTAVVGTNGALSYRLNLDDFPGSGWAFTYFAEIEELDLNQSRKFRLILPGAPDLSKPVVDIQENAPGKYRLYEPGYYNISLPFVLSFKFMKTSESSLGPLLNAMEISKYLKKVHGSLDGALMASIVSKYSSAIWAREGGDPCLPVPWSWVQCDTETQPSIIMICQCICGSNLSKRNLSGNIPEEFAKLSGLVQLLLDGNLLTDTIPDFSGCTNLRIIHLENNQLTGKLPSSLASLPNLKELYVQNNMLSGPLPSGLQVKSLILNYTGNAGIDKEGKEWSHTEVIIGASIAVACLLIMSSALFFYMQKGRRRQYRCSDKQQHSIQSQRLSSSFADAVSDTAHGFSLSEIEEATRNFEKKIGSGGFGVVYYGKLKDGKEIAVKLLTNNSFQGKREFANEVSLLSRIHHRNLVQFYGCCQEEDKSMLVYEYMHNGTLKEHLYGPLACQRGMSWIKRLEVAVDAAKGIEYLHSGCIPAVIHRDLKSSNILLDRHMQAKVSDFGLSKLAVEGASHVSSMVRGTVGYLDPEYYISQQLTDKSDMYSFGVILLELISGREAISNEVFGPNCRNIVQWAKWHIESGNILGIIDPILGGEYDIQSMWKIAEKALMCVRPHGSMRPSISEVIIDIQDAIAIEKGAEVIREGYSDEISSRTPMHPTSTDDPWAFDQSILQPDAR